MRHELKALALAAFVATIPVLATLTAAADPLVQQVYSREALGGDDYFDWGALGPLTNANNFVPNPSSLFSNSGNISAVVGNPAYDYRGLSRKNQGICNGSTGGWLGSYVPCERLLFAQVGPPVMDITLSHPVRRIGAQLENGLWLDSENFMAVYGPQNQLIGTYSVVYPLASRQAFAGTNPFLGVSAGLPVIKRVVYWTVHFYTPGQPLRGNFAVNQLDIYRGPEPDVELLLSSLLTDVTGVGSGKSLADKVQLAQVYFAVPDVQSTCAVMDDFVKQVNALAGKKLTPGQALEFTLTANVITATIGCN